MKTYLDLSIQTQLSSSILQMLHKIQEKKIVKEFKSKRGEKKYNTLSQVLKDKQAESTKGKKSKRGWSDFSTRRKLEIVKNGHGLEVIFFLIFNCRIIAL